MSATLAIPLAASPGRRALARFMRHRMALAGLAVDATRFVIGVGPGHHFEKQNAVRCADLHDQAYVNRLQCEFFGHARKIFREHGARTRIVFRSDRDDWVQSMAMAGIGFTFIPEYAVTMPGLRVRPLIEPELTRTIQVVTVRGRPHVPAVAAFVREILA